MPRFRHFLPLVKLIPLRIGDNLKNLLDIIAKYLDGAEDELDKVPAEYFALSATEASIADWEFELGITDIAPDIEARRLEIYLRNKGDGISTSGDLIGIAAALGMDAEIIRYHPFQAGISRVGDRCWDETWLLRIDMLIKSPATAKQLADLRFSVSSFLPAEVLGGIIYNNQYIQWR